MPVLLEASVYHPRESCRGGAPDSDPEVGEVEPAQDLERQI